LLVALDGELMPDGTMWVFDLVNMDRDDNTQVLPSDPFTWRHRWLVDTFETWQPPSTMFRLAPTAFSYEAKLELALDCVRRATEGVIARKLTAPYRPGTRSTNMVKLKFIHDADLVVMSIGFEGRDNVVLGAYTPEGKLIEVGRASAHGKGAFAEDDVVVVRYNYMSRDGRLVGPRIIRRRTDKPATECSTEQLFYTQEVPVYEH
jgi:ATP-dependent DNA ligase